VGALEHRSLFDVQLEERGGQTAVLGTRVAAGAGAFLVAEGDDRKREGGTRRHLECRDHSERPVEASAVRDRVEVRTDPESRVAAAADRVSRAVRLDL